MAGKKRQQNQDEAAYDDAEAESSAPAPPENGGAVSDDGIEELKKLAELKEQGVLTQDEFEAQKQKILGT